MIKLYYCPENSYLVILRTCFIERKEKRQRFEEHSTSGVPCSHHKKFRIIYVFSAFHLDFQTSNEAAYDFSHYLWK